MPAMPCALVERLKTIPAPRRQSEKLKHPLVELILLGRWGVVAGCENFVEIAAWGKVNEAFLRPFLAVPPSIASHATFTRVFALLPPATVQAVLLPWLLERRGVAGDSVHLDGKTLRGTRCQQRKVKALHGVSAGAGQSGITLGQVAVAAKSNEITAMPELLNLLDLHEKIVTTEALGGQKAIAQTSVTGGGDSILAVKDNQPPLQAELPAAFAQAPLPQLRSPRVATPDDKGHGREEQRTVRALPAHASLSAAQCARWLGGSRW
jgi:predicted transposase YbfD/YdcC